MTANQYLPEGEIFSSQENKDYISSIYGLEKAMASGKIIEGIAVMCESADMSLQIELCGGNVMGIIPKSESLYNADDSEPKDIAIITRVGKAVCFKVKEIIYPEKTAAESDENHIPIALLSRRDAQIECAENFHSQLRCGDIIPAVVTHLEPFGAFVDIGCGLVSLLSVDCISVSRISHPGDRISVRDKIMTIVKSIDCETRRIYVSQRELLGTWEENVSGLKAGQTVAGIIRSIEEYGIFVELTPNLAGLAELCDEESGTMKSIAPGQTCAVYIKSILPERMKIKLVLIDAYKREKVDDASKFDRTRFSAERNRVKYFIDTDVVKHIDKWQYSPENCKKIIETNFSLCEIT